MGNRKFFTKETQVSCTREEDVRIFRHIFFLNAFLNHGLKRRSHYLQNNSPQLVWLPSDPCDSPLNVGRRFPTRELKRPDPVPWPPLNTSPGQAHLPGRPPAEISPLWSSMANPSGGFKTSFGEGVSLFLLCLILLSLRIQQYSFSRIFVNDDFSK